MGTEPQNKNKGPLIDVPEYGPQPDKAVLEPQSLMSTVGDWLGILLGILQGPIDAIRSIFPKDSWLAAIFGTPEDDANRRAYDLELQQLALFGARNKDGHYSFAEAGYVPNDGDARSRFDPSDLPPGEKHGNANYRFEDYFGPNALKKAPDVNNAFASAVNVGNDPDPYKPDFNAKPATSLDIKVA